jgi:hypothetical protein
MSKPTARMSELADRLNYFSRANLAIIRRSALAPGGEPISMSSAIAMALAVTAAAIEAGECGRYLSSNEGAWMLRPILTADTNNL